MRSTGSGSLTGIVLKFFWLVLNLLLLLFFLSEVRLKSTAAEAKVTRLLSDIVFVSAGPFLVLLLSTRRRYLILGMRLTKFIASAY